MTTQTTSQHELASVNKVRRDGGRATPSGQTCEELTDDALLARYTSFINIAYGRLSGHDARVELDCMGDELLWRGITHVQNRFSPGGRYPVLNDWVSRYG